MGFAYNIFRTRYCATTEPTATPGEVASSSHNKSPEPRQPYAGNLRTDTIGERDAENTPVLVIHAQFARCFKQESKQPVPRTVFAVLRAPASECTRFFLIASRTLSSCWHRLHLGKEAGFKADTDLKS